MKKILLLCLLSISFSQEIDYSKMSDAEKIMMYDTMKKSPVAAGFLELIPTAGYAYSGKWKRGLMIKGTGVLIAGTGEWLRSTSRHTAQVKSLGLGMIMLGSIGYLYSYYDVVNQTSKYNKRLKRRIFGKKKKRMKASLYPLQDGAGISLTYSMN